MVYILSYEIAFHRFESSILNTIAVEKCFKSCLYMKIL